MTTDLSNKSVKQLRRMAPGHDDLLHNCMTGEAADELARRLEEAQKCQTKAVEDFRDLHVELVEVQQKNVALEEKWNAAQTQINRLVRRNAAHDAKVAAAALDEIVKPLALLGLQSDRYQDDNEFRDAVDDVLQAISCSAEYRAKAGRKE